MPAPNDRLVRLKEAAKRFGVNRQTLYNWEKAGHLPPRTKIGRGVAGYWESELNALVEAQRETAAA